MAGRKRRLLRGASWSLWGGCRGPDGQIAHPDARDFPACHLTKEEVGRAAQAFFEADGRLPAEELACGGDVGPGVPDVAGAGRLIVPGDLLAEDPADRRCDLVHARRRAGGDVERL